MGLALFRISELGEAGFDRHRAADERARIDMRHALAQQIVALEERSKIAFGRAIAPHFGRAIAAHESGRAQPCHQSLAAHADQRAGTAGCRGGGNRR